MGHELYCAGHLIQAGVAFGARRADESLLTVARRFADLIDDVFGDGSRAETDGHPEIEVALVELYRRDGRAPLPRASLTRSSTRRGFGLFAGGRFDLRYYQDAEPVRDARSIVGHAVRALYLAAGVTDLYAETGDDALLASMLRQWDDLASTKTYLTGGVGSRHYDEAFGDSYELPPDRAYCETCAAIASIMWNWRLLLVTGESRFADLLERTLYNGFLVGPLARRRGRSSTRTRCSRAAASAATAGTRSPAARRTSCACSPLCTTTSPRPATVASSSISTRPRRSTPSCRSRAPSSWRSRRATRGRGP